MIAKIAASILFLLLFVSASKPSLDGRAVVAPQGELPPGLYVKSAAFLPGDTVLITNPAAKVSVEALVFASFSASDGIAVVLSPEAAKLLFIERGSNSIVQVTKNGGDMELSVLSKAYDALPLNEEPVVEAVGAIEDVQPEPPVAVVKTDEVPAEIVSGESELAEAEDTSVFTPFAEQSTEEVAAAPSVEEESAEPEVPAESEGTNEETALAEAQPAETEEVSAEEVPAEIAAADEVPAESEEATQEAEDIEQPGTADSEGEKLALADDKAADDSEVAEVQSAESAEVEEPVNEPNVLLAAEDNPPETTESVFDEPIVETAVADNTGNAETLPDYFAHTQEVPQEVSAEPVPVVEPSHTSVDDSNAFAARNENLERYIIQNVRDFGKGTYCIQLATYKDPANIAGFIEKYSDKYPVRLAYSEKIDGAYQVLIGPLNKDEYPVVLKRFVAWGYKDAFLREIR